MITETGDMNLGFCWQIVKRYVAPLRVPPATDWMATRRALTLSQEYCPVKVLDAADANRAPKPFGNVRE